MALEEATGLRVAGLDLLRGTVTVATPTGLFSRRQTAVHCAMQTGATGSGCQRQRRLGWRAPGFTTSAGPRPLRLVAGGVDIKTAQVRLGHSDPRLTLAIYAEATSAADRGAAELLGAQFLGRSRTNRKNRQKATMLPVIQRRTSSHNGRLVPLPRTGEAFPGPAVVLGRRRMDRTSQGDLACLTWLGKVVLDVEFVVVTPDGQDFELVAGHVHASRHN